MKTQVITEVESLLLGIYMAGTNFHGILHGNGWSMALEILRVDSRSLRIA